MTKDELNDILESHSQWVEGERDGERANLQGADLRWADLQGADLQGADLQGANLRGADLYGANLRGANLYRANLYRANLYRANLYRADLRRADLLVCQAEDITAYIQKGISKIGCQRLPNTTIRAMSADDWEAIEKGAGELWTRYGPMVLAAIDAVEAGTEEETDE